MPRLKIYDKKTNSWVYADSAFGKDGKSAYEYAKDGGYPGTESEFALKLAKEYPTKLSELENDSGFITSIPNEYITETELNNKGYLTEHQSLEYIEDQISELATYILDIDYDSMLAFDVSEIIFGTTKSSILGQAILGQMVLG